MKHVWTDHPPTQLLGNPRRICTNVGCGAIQERTQDYWYMRVVRTYWDPLVGRCKGTAPAPVLKPKRKRHT